MRFELLIKFNVTNVNSDLEVCVLCVCLSFEIKTIVVPFQVLH